MPSRRRDDDDDDDFDDRRGRRGRREEPSLPLGVIVPVLSVIGIGLVVGLILLVRGGNKPEKPDEPVARAEPDDTPVAAAAPADDGVRWPAAPPEAPAVPKLAAPPPPDPPAAPPTKGTPLPPVPDLPAPLGETTPLGGTAANARFREFREGAPLVGFELTYGRIGDVEAITYLRPIYRIPPGEPVMGLPYGYPKGPVVTAAAPDGYAVGGCEVWCERYLRGIRFTYMKVTPAGLDPDDSARSDWYGDQSARPPKKAVPARATFSPPLPLVVGLHGTRFEDTGDDLPGCTGAINSLGFVVQPVKPAEAAADPVPFGRVPVWPIPRPLPPGWRASKTFGKRDQETEFSEFRTDGAVLIGFEIGTDVKYFRPIWLTPAGVEELGAAYGRSATTVVLKARDGYVVNGMTAGTGAFGSELKGLSLIFAKRDSKKGVSTAVKDAYTSEWVGEQLGHLNKPETLRTLNLPVVGISGRRDPNTGEIRGLALTIPDKVEDWAVPVALPKLPKLRPVRTAKVGGYMPEHDPNGEDRAPPPGWLVGVEVWLTKRNGGEAVNSLRAMYLTGDQPSDGPRRGNPPNAWMERAVRAVAKPGYAVGAMTVKSDKEVSGFSLTFMRVKGGKLDPTDAYESEWIGGAGATKTLLGGDGSPVIGLFSSFAFIGQLKSVGLVLGSDDF